MKTDSIATLVSAVALAVLAAAAPARGADWTTHGPGGVAQVNDVVVVGTSAFAATLNGVFRSDDGGTTWQPSGLQRLPTMRLLARPGVGVLALVGERFAALYTSSDSGVSWQALSAPDYVIAAGIDPAEPSTYLAATPSGQILRSADGGASWQNVSSLSDVTDIAFGSGGIYALTSESFYKSADAGATWTSVQPPGFFATAIGVGSTAGVVYAAGSGGFCRSADSAATWSCASSVASFSVSRMLEVSGPSGAVPRLLLATDQGVRMSKDGGVTFGPVASGPVSDQIQALGSDASGSLVLAGTATTMFRSPDRGDTWADHSAGLQSVWISGLALDPSNPMSVWAGSPGLFRSVDGGLSWSSAGSGGPGGQSIFAIAFDPEHPTTMFVGAANALYRSEDGGQNWTAPLSSGAAAIAVDPHASQTVLAGGGGGVSHSDDGGQTWQPSAIAQGVYSLLFDRLNPSRVYAGSFWDVDVDYNEIYGGSIFVSNNHGATFTKGSTHFGSPVNAIIADPFLDGVIYAAARGVFRSADGGATWTGSTPGIDVNPAPIDVLRIVADPVRPGTLYCSTGWNLFRSTDSGGTWTTFSDGLQPLEVVELAISPDGTKLHAGTAGGGVFERDLDDVAGVPCVPSATRLCLIGSRYAVDLYTGSGAGPGAARELSDRAGYFALPGITGKSELPEVVVKMLPAGSFGHGESAPVFYASLTTVPYWLIVTDTNTGTRKTYASHPGAPLCGAADLAFGASAASTPMRAADELSAQNAVMLLDGRFSVSLEAHQPGAGAVVSTRAMTSGDGYAFFSFPGVSGDPQFPEVVVKVVDGRSINGRFWIFQTNLTSLEYTLTVTDSVTAIVKSYESATPFCGSADTQTFANSP